MCTGICFRTPPPGGRGVSSPQAGSQPTPLTPKKAAITPFSNMSLDKPEHFLCCTRAVFCVCLIWKRRLFSPAFYLDPPHERRAQVALARVALSPQPQRDEAHPCGHNSHLRPSFQAATPPPLQAPWALCSPPTPPWLGPRTISIVHFHDEINLSPILEDSAPTSPKIQNEAEKASSLKTLEKCVEISELRF